ncbi:MAG: serine hydrolase [Bacilli bacterium]|nr:serine hydrolase [Bacilli bacterium]
MKKILLFILLLIPISTFGLELPNTYSEIVMLYDLTDDQVLIEKNSDKKTNIASLTKIMTTITALELNNDLSKKIKISESMLAGIPADASIAHLNLGETYTFEDLLYASILPSGADATQSIAVSTSGSISNFVKEMNTIAKKIGVTNTHFVNVTGLDVENHYSTAKDVMKILKYALGNPTFKKIYCTREYLLSNNQKVESTIKMYSQKMNIDVSRIKGSKTGYTSKAGICISALTNILDHEVIVITMKAPYVYGDFYNIKDANTLIDFLEDSYKYEEIIPKDTVVKNIAVELAKIDTYEIKTKNNFKKFLPKDYNKDLVLLEYEGKNMIDYNNQPGEELGQIKYYYNDELIGSEVVTLDMTIEPDAIKIIKANKIPILIIAAIIFLLIICFGLLSSRKKRRR